MFHLALGVVFWLHLIALAIETVEILFLHLAGTFAEHTIESPVGDEWTCIEVFVEVKSVAFYLLGGHAKRWGELAEQSVHGVDGNLPNAEEAKHMVDAVSVEILCHLGKASYPP